MQISVTDFTASGITPEVSLKGLIARIDGLTLENTGTSTKRTWVLTRRINHATVKRRRDIGKKCCDRFGG